MFKLSLLPKVKRILRYLLPANDEIRPLYETLWKTQTTLFKAVFTIGARALVAGHKMVLCSDTGCPIYHCPVQCPRPCTRARALCPNSGVGT